MRNVVKIFLGMHYIYLDYGRGLRSIMLVSVSVSIIFIFPGGDEINTDAVTWTRHLTGCGQLAVMQVVMKGGSKAASLPTTSHNNTATSQCAIL